MLTLHSEHYNVINAEDNAPTMPLMPRINPIPKAKFYQEKTSPTPSSTFSKP
jgi:hypothetical protein